MRCPRGQRSDALAQLLQLLAHQHAAFTGVGHAFVQLLYLRFQFTLQTFQRVSVILLALTFTEVGQQTFGVMLLTQAGFQFVETQTQRRELFGMMALVSGIAQQFAPDLPRILPAYLAGNTGDQRQRLFKLAVRRFRHAQLLLQAQQPFGGLFFARLEGFLPLCGVVDGEVRQLTLRPRFFQRLQRLLILNGTGLLHIKRLLKIGQLAFQLVDFNFRRFSARFVLFLHLTRFGHHFILLFETISQLFQIGVVTRDLLLLTHRCLDQIKVIARRLIIGFQIALCAVVLRKFARHFDVTILF